MNAGYAAALVLFANSAMIQKVVIGEFREARLGVALFHETQTVADDADGRRITAGPSLFLLFSACVGGIGDCLRYHIWDSALRDSHVRSGTLLTGLISTEFRDEPGNNRSRNSFRGRGTETTLETLA